MMKTQEEYFRDWESHVFGYGYGSGEPYVIPALRNFLMLCGKGSYGHGYDYTDLQKRLGETVAWLLINALCKADIIEYGTSPRFGWLTPKGVRLKQFVASHLADDLVGIVCNHDDNYAHCYPTACNCGEHGYEKGRVCNNPFWLDIPTPPEQPSNGEEGE